MMDLLLPPVKTPEREYSPMIRSPVIITFCNAPIDVVFPSCDCWVDGMWTHILKGTYHLEFDPAEDYSDAFTRLFSDPSNDSGHLFIPEDLEVDLEARWNRISAVKRDVEMHSPKLSYGEVREVQHDDVVAIEIEQISLLNAISTCSANVSVVLPSDDTVHLVRVGSECIKAVDSACCHPVKKKMRKMYIKKPRRTALVDMTCDEVLDVARKCVGPELHSDIARTIDRNRSRVLIQSNQAKHLTVRMTVDGRVESIDAPHLGERSSYRDLFNTLKNVVIQNPDPGLDKRLAVLAWLYSYSDNRVSSLYNMTALQLGLGS
jgi:hypothetical protein